MSLVQERPFNQRAPAWLAFPLAIAVACGPHSEEGRQPEAVGGNTAADVAAVNSLVEKYALSVNEANTAIASEVWLTSDRVSFINPIGHQKGWEAIARNIYEEAMEEGFSARKLTPQYIGINVYGETAIAEFNWVFDATRRDDGSVIQTNGRETQVYARTDDQGWRLVHVHYPEAPD